MRFLIILMVGLVACNQPEPTQKVESKNSVSKRAVSISDTLTNQSVDTIASYDSTIYKQYIPQQLTDLLTKELPEWHFLSPSNWNKFWFKEYKKENALVNYLTSDFNCDQKQDYTLILANKKGELAVWVMQSDKEQYKAIKLHELGQAERPIEVGLELIPKGKLNYIDFDNDNPKPINLKCSAIQVVFFERAAVTYYWNKGKYESVQTGD